MRTALTRSVWLISRRLYGIHHEGVRFASSTPGSSSIPSSPLPDDYTVNGGDDSGPSGVNVKSIGRALEAYLNEARNHSKMIAKERVQYELGKRHLANIMGIDPNNITQQDIDKFVFFSSITYCLLEFQFYLIITILINYLFLELKSESIVLKSLSSFSSKKNYPS